MLVSAGPISTGEVGSGKAEARNRIIWRGGECPLECGGGILDAPLGQTGPPQIDERGNRPGVDADHGLEFADGVIDVSLFEQGEAEIRSRAEVSRAVAKTVP